MAEKWGLTISNRKACWVRALQFWFPRLDLAAIDPPVCRGLSRKLQSDHQCSPVPCSVELADDLWIRKVMYSRNCAAQQCHVADGKRGPW